MLRHVAEPRAHADRVVGHVDAADLDAAVGRVRESEQDPERRGLAGTVRADETDPTARHLDVEVVERGDVAVALGEPVDAEEGCICHDDV